MKIVVLDGHVENPGDLSWDEIGELGDLTLYDRTEKVDEEIIRRIGDAEIVLTGNTPIDACVTEACRNIRFIGVLATGYDFVDIDSASQRGIVVANVPNYGTASVAQYAISLLLEICGHVAHHSQSVHDGKWAECEDWWYWDTPLIELDGKTMGIIGFGSIGKQTGRIAKALGMNILATGSRPTEEGRAIADYVDMDTLLSSSDVVVLHCPLFPETRNIINRETIAKMKDGVILINNSRGQLVAEQDLADALNSGKVYAAGLDVVSSEPIAASNPLLKAKNCFITPHISWAPKESRQRILDITRDNIQGFLGGKPFNVVNG